MSTGSRGGSIFEPGGLQWAPVPVALKEGLARTVFAAIMQITGSRTITTAPDRVFAHVCGLSTRTVQLGLRELEAMGWIERLRRRGSRRIIVKIRLAGSTRGEKLSAKHLKMLPYQAYLETDHWKALREKTLDRDGRACRLCGSTEDLNVHHRTYERIGCELPMDVITLCRGCHAKFHSMPTG